MKAPGEGPNRKETVFQIVLLRHGESLWNREGRFTGWTDIDLSPQGREEARRAARHLSDAGFTFDAACTSVLRRAIRTLWIVLDELDLMYIPVCHSWRLNERHYGALQGMDKRRAAEKYGEAVVRAWRRGYANRPPALPKNDPRHPQSDPRYAGLGPDELPVAESLADTLERVLPYWETVIAPSVLKGKRILVVAHGNSIRALIKFLDNVPDDEITGLEIPTGLPLVYELDESLHPIRHYYLGGEEKIPKTTEVMTGQQAAERMSGEMP